MIEVSTAVWVNSIFPKLAKQGCEIQVKSQPVSAYPSLWAPCCLQSLLAAQFQCAGVGRKYLQPGTAACAPGLGGLTCCWLRITCEQIGQNWIHTLTKIERFCSSLLVSQGVKHKQLQVSTQNFNSLLFCSLFDLADFLHTPWQNKGQGLQW